MVELQASPRPIFGKAVKKLRAAGFLPAVLYGEGIPSLPVSISLKDFEKIRRQSGESVIIALHLAGTGSDEGGKFNVLIHDIQRDPLKGTPLHADFYAVRMDKTIRTHIPIGFSGESPAVKNFGGILVKVMQEMEIEALPADLPSFLPADLSSLDTIGARLLVKHLAPPSGVKFFSSPDEIIAVVEPPRSEEEMAELSKTPETAPREVKTEREIKTETKEKKETGEDEGEGEK
jgi:large subunit ribosomal protein L25